MLRNRLRIRLLGTVPVSIALHLVAVLFLVIIPLVANVATPLPNEVAPGFIRATPLPPPPAVRHPTRTPRGPIPARNDAAPTVAPTTIGHERLTADAAVPELGVGVSNAGAGGFGTAVAPIAAPPARARDLARHAGPVRAGELPVAPVKIADAQPVYPDIARAAHMDGTVILECVIDTTGRVTNIRVLKSVPLLDQAAIDAVGQWRYTPSVYNGRPVSVLMTVTVRFVLK